MCKVTKDIYLEQVTVLVKRIELNPTCPVGNILPVAVAVVLFHAISPGYGGLGLERHIYRPKSREGHILLNKMLSSTTLDICDTRIPNGKDESK